jgi:peptide methionine sulfoxide reductase MsrA
MKAKPWPLPQSVLNSYGEFQGFCDLETQHQSAIFYLNSQEQDLAQSSKEQPGKPPE